MCARQPHEIWYNNIDALNRNHIIRYWDILSAPCRPTEKQIVEYAGWEMGQKSK